MTQHSSGSTLHAPSSLLAMLRRSFLSLCGLAAGSLPEHCSLWLSSHVTHHSSQPALAGQACLQNRLNEIGENLAIEIRGW